MTTSAASELIVTPPGLAGVVVAETAIGDARGAEGFLHYRQYDATRLARDHSFEDVWHLMLRGSCRPATVVRRGRTRWPKLSSYQRNWQIGWGLSCGRRATTRTPTNVPPCAQRPSCRGW
nr:citrate/2-methylcitrate synthase [Flexivirga meconopsidis]